MRDSGLTLSSWVVDLSAVDAAMLLVLAVGVVFAGVGASEVWRRFRSR
jgi:hypothetical protein